ncbi:Tetratricopeptide repeat protein [Planctomycetes bacterium Pan216]|uniref:Tetratricopeptide repeat protein n=1 Tax=Kolteria novifilia TaxID=2527975 RepID=A0A518AX38_9BACT|nr:Tetratricopeptide repeat protein [Planctomycetes bacterium Pan216]
MEYDEFGFPVPEQFEDQKPRYRAKITPGRIAVLMFVLFLGVLIAFAAEYGDKLADNFKDGLARLAANRPMRIEAQIISRLQRGDVDGALKASDELAKLVPKAGFLWRGEILMRVSRPGEAAKTYHRLVELDPTDHLALNNRAYALALAEENLDEAMENVNQAIDIAGDVPAYIDTRGYLLYLSGRVPEALEDFNKVLSDQARRSQTRDAGIGELFFHRALAYKALGKEELAKKDFNTATRFGFLSDREPQPLKPIVESKEEGEEQAKETPPAPNESEVSEEAVEPSKP